MPYRNFVAPDFAKRAHATPEWIDWLADLDGVLVPVAPQHPHACQLCLGSSGYLDGGPATWNRCSNCKGYAGAVDSFIPITYSLDAGLESMLHRYKDFQGYDWLGWALSSLLHEFLEAHSGCVEAEAGGTVDVATIVPSNDQRAFNHLEQLVFGVVENDPLAQLWNWETSFLSRAPATPRPARGHLTPDAYVVAPFVVEGSRVLLLDDTWTSGSSAASAAAALKRAGAVRVVVLALGRQLNLTTAYGSTREVFDDQSAEEWRLDTCVVCG